MATSGCRRNALAPGSGSASGYGCGCGCELLLLDNLSGKGKSPTNGSQRRWWTGLVLQGDRG